MNVSIDQFFDILPTRNEWPLIRPFSDKFRAAIEERQELVFMPIDFYSKIISGRQYYFVVSLAPGGVKYVVIIDNYKVYLDVDLETQVGGQKLEDKIDEITKAICTWSAENSRFAKINRGDFTYKVIEASSLKAPKFYFGPRKFLRLFFKSKYHYKDAKAALSGAKFNLYSNDSDSDQAMFKRIFRNASLNASNWNKVKNYEVVSEDTIRNCSKCSEIKEVNENCEAEHRYEQGFRCESCNYPFHTCYNCYVRKKLLPQNMRGKNEAICIMASLVDLSPCSPLEQDKINRQCNDQSLISMAWDIETYSKDQTGMLVTHDVENYKLYMISLVFYWHNSDVPLYKVCLVDKLCNDGPELYVENSILEHHAKKYKMGLEDAKAQLAQNIYIVNCANENEVIRNMGLIFGRFSPDITLAFNCSKFDWPVLFAKAIQYSQLGLYKNYMCIDGWYNDNIGEIRPIDVAETDYGPNNTGARPHLYFNKNERIKVTADLTLDKLFVPKFRGFVNIDVMILLRIIHSRAEVGNKYSLNFYVQEVYGLGAKYDLDYKTQWKYYEKYEKYLRWQSRVDRGGENNRKVKKYLQERGIKYKQFLAELKKKRDKSMADMTEEALYCLTDSEHCQRLILGSGRLPYLLALSNVTYISLFETFWRADGSKVRNYLYYQAQNENILINQDVEHQDIKIKYSGAKVYEPTTGMSRVPVGALDFSALYPSIMRAYNCSPEKAIVDDGRPETYEIVGKLEAAGYELKRVETRGMVKKKVEGQMFMRDNGPDIEQDDPNIEQNNGPKVGQMMEIRGWLIWHQNKDVPDEARPLECVGIFAKCVANLINHRKLYKKKFALLKGLIERIEKDGPEYVKANFTSILAELRYTESYFQDELGLTIDDLSDLIKLNIHMNNHNSAQLAVKVICNTFYGQQGSVDSPLYHLLVAASIPHFGRQSIEKVSKIIDENNFVVHYGDTDSNYISCQLSKFDDIRAVFDEYMNALLSMNGMAIEDIVPLRAQDKGVEKAVFEAIGPAKDEYAGKMAQAMAGFRAARNSSLMKGHVQGHVQECAQGNVQPLARIDNLLAKYKHLYLGLAQDVYKIIKSQGCEGIFHNDPCAASVVILALREEFWTQMVQLTRLYILDLQDYINEFFREETKTPYLCIVIEEVLWPIILLGKKKYAGIEHVDKEIFRVEPNKIFKRGVEMIKQGQTKLNKTIGNEILMRILGLDNFATIEYHVMEIAEYYFKQQWPIESYVLSAKIKTTTNNVSLGKFRARMQALYEAQTDPELAQIVKPPDYNDNFKYVLIKMPKYTIIGNISKEVQKGDRMLYFDHYKYLTENGLDLPMDPKYYYGAQDFKATIDHEHYVEKLCIGTLARFLTYDKKFWPGVYDESQSYAEYDKKIIANIKKFLNKEFSPLFNNGVNTAVVELLKRGMKEVQLGLSAYELGAEEPQIQALMSLYGEYIEPANPKIKEAHESQYGPGPGTIEYLEHLCGAGKAYIQDWMANYKALRQKYKAPVPSSFVRQVTEECRVQTAAIDAEVSAFNNNFKEEFLRYNRIILGCLNEVNTKVAVGALDLDDAADRAFEYLAAQGLVSGKLATLTGEFARKLEAYKPIYVRKEALGQLIGGLGK